MSKACFDKAYTTVVEMAVETMTNHSLYPGQDRHADEKYFISHIKRTARLRVYRDPASPCGYGAAIAFRRSAPQMAEGWLLDYVLVPYDLVAQKVVPELHIAFPANEFYEEHRALLIFEMMAEKYWDMQPEFWRQWKSILQNSQPNFSLKDSVKQQCGIDHRRIVSYAENDPVSLCSHWRAENGEDDWVWAMDRMRAG